MKELAFQANLKRLAKENNFFRKVLHTGKHSQLVLMSIAVDEEIGEETHETIDQILFFVSGMGEAILEGKSKLVEKGDVVFVPAGTLHNFRNTGQEDMKLYTVYSPPQHPDGTVHRTREEAESAEN